MNKRQIQISHYEQEQVLVLQAMTKALNEGRTEDLKELEVISQINCNELKRLYKNG